jgi:hypothetical protein
MLDNGALLHHDAVITNNVVYYARTHELCSRSLLRLECMQPRREPSHIPAAAIILNRCGAKSSLTRNEFFCDMLQGTRDALSQHSMNTYTHAI